MITDFGKLTEDWYGLKSVVLYGAGTVAGICSDLFKMIDVSIDYVIDANQKKQGMYWNGVPIVSFESVKNDVKRKKIVVMTAHTAFNEISEVLIKNGLQEFRDFCRIGQFVSEWLWRERKMNCVYHVDMTVATSCSLNCKNCNMFIPYYKEHKIISLEELKSNVDLFFERIDYVVYFGLIGGEPLLNKNLGRIIEYIVLNYGEKVGRVTFTTNGMQIPDDDFLEIIKKHNVLMEISDYSGAVDYNGKLRKLLEVLGEKGVNFSVREVLVWCDFGFPYNIKNRTKAEIEDHLACCRPEWNGLNDGRFYYCNVAWSAAKSGLYHLSAEDYIELSEIDKESAEQCHRLALLSRGTCSFCKLCGGCGKDNESIVTAGEQFWGRL